MTKSAGAPDLPGDARGPGAGAVLLLGATGRLGRLVRAAGLPPGVRLAGRAGAGLDWCADPLEDPQGQGRAIAARFGRPAAVICLSGVVPGGAQALALNSDLALAALALGRAAGAARVLLPSSAAVYGRAGGPLPETAAPTPASAYGAAKAEMEARVRAAAGPADGPAVCCLRIGNVAGADALLGQAPQAVPALDIFANGQGPRRSYIGPHAFAAALWHLAACADLPPVLNLALPGLVAMDDLMRAAGRPFAPRPAPEGALAAVELDCARAVALGAVPAAPARAEAIVADLARLRLDSGGAARERERP